MSHFNYTKFLCLTLALTLALSSKSQLKGDSYISAKSKGTASLTYIYDGVPGFVEKGPDGKEKGLLVDIMNRFEKFIRETEGIETEVTFYQVPNKDFTTFMNEVKNGEGGVFGLSNVSIKEERKKTYSFSPPYIKNVSVLITNNNTTTLTSLESINTSFADKTAYSVSSSTYYNRIDEIRQNHFPGMKIESLNSVDAILEQIANNDNAFAIVDLNYYLQAIKNYKIKRHAVGDKGEDVFGIIMPKNNDWQSLLRKFFDTGFVGSVEYRKIITENLGKGALRLLESTN